MQISDRLHMSSLGKDHKMQWENKMKGSLYQGYLEQDKQALSQKSDLLKPEEKSLLFEIPNTREVSYDMVGIGGGINLGKKTLWRRDVLKFKSKTCYYCMWRKIKDLGAQQHRESEGERKLTI